MAKKEVRPVLCDSNILFEFLRGNEAVQAALKKIGTERIAFSIITHAEAYAGASKLNFVVLKHTLAKYKLYHFSQSASHTFNGLMQSNHHRHSKWIPDAIIASIALDNNLELYTLNKKDFNFIEGLKLYK